jgi:hypothetical protein
MSDHDPGLEQKSRNIARFSPPRELRDEIYALVFTDNDMGGRPIMRIREDITPRSPPPTLMLTCKPIYHEAQPYFIQSLKFVISNDASSCLMQQWLAKKAPKSIRNETQAVVFTTFVMFRTVSEME